VTSLAGESVRERVENLYYEYGEAIDETLERWPDFFTEDAVYKVIPRENYDRGLPLASILCEGRGMILDRVMAVRKTVVHAKRLMRHMIGNIRLRAAGDEIAAHANFAIYETFEESTTRLFVVGRYIDRIVDAGGELRFKEKLCVFDGDLVQGSLIYPL
jgi:3-phenylpropionate/cinnamic acid dioxygenase small subunit